MLSGLYAASKRSLEILSETLRLELQPFGVHVSSIVTGAVQTNGQTYFEDWKLPRDSLYKPIESTIHKRARGGDGVIRMNTMEYAEQVVKSIVGRNSDGRFWCGANATRTKLGSAITPQRISVSFLIKQSKMTKSNTNISNKGWFHGDGMWIGRACKQIEGDLTLRKFSALNLSPE